jgi:ATP-dependent DNA helicase RecG
MLVMTATPIPRTLVLAAFGDMDVSKLTEKPAGPQADPDRHRAAGAHRRDRRAAARGLAEGKKAYWICPLVEESETSDLDVRRGAACDAAGVFGHDKSASCTAA